MHKTTTIYYIIIITIIIIIIIIILMENDNFKLYWNRRILTDKTITFNRSVKHSSIKKQRTPFL